MLMAEKLRSGPVRVLLAAFVIIPLFLVVEIPVFLAGSGLAAYIQLSKKAPQIPEILNYQPRTVSTFFADDGTVIGVFYQEKRFVVDLSQVPQHVQNAFLAAEDARFFQHAGIDWHGLARALIRNLKQRRMAQGGSTITMQVTRNFLLTREKRLSRKIMEMILATRLEEAWGKKKILHIYLNEIYLGEGAYGVEAAARNYFDKPVERLTLAEAAMIAGLVAGPARFNPFKSVELAERRQRIVLNNMVKAGFITEAERQEALAQKLEYRKETPRPFDLAPDFAEAVRLYIIEKYGAEKLYNEGLKVFTTCKLDFQQKAVAAVRKGLDEIRARRKDPAVLGTLPKEQIPDLLARRTNPTLTEGRLYQAIVTKVIQRKNKIEVELAVSPLLKGKAEIESPTFPYRPGNVLAVRFSRFVDETPFFVLDSNPVIQGALVMIENRTGYVRALVGGASSEHYKFNRATQALRQPGSAFKPIIYAAAIENKGYTPATVIVDEPIVVDIETRDEEWAPKNAGRDFLGPISMRHALEYSRNICTVKILMDVDLEPVIDLAHAMGIRSPLGKNLSLSLGTSEVTLFELTSAYTVFPNGGAYLTPTMVKRVEDRFGNVLEDNTRIPVLDADSTPTPQMRVDVESSGPDGAGVAGVGAANATTAIEKARMRKASTNPEPAPAGDKVERSVVAALSPQTAYILTDMMQGGVRSGTGARLNQYVRRKDIAGKTGTTNHAEDAWFIGFTPDFTAGVWVGFDEKRPLGLKEEGGRAALPIWGHLMKDVLAKVKERNFPVPPDIAFVDLPTFSGNPKDGFFPKIVREPVFAPFTGRTLVVSPLDPPDIFTAYLQPAPPASGDQARSPQDLQSYRRDEAAPHGGGHELRE
jgi:penicillin-binding protein 1A